jgi:hypothetical protein
MSVLDGGRDAGFDTRSASVMRSPDYLSCFP